MNQQKQHNIERDIYYARARVLKNRLRSQLSKPEKKEKAVVRVDSSTALMPRVRYFVIGLVVLSVLGFLLISNAHASDKKKFNVNRSIESQKKSDRLEALEKIILKKEKVSIQKLKQIKQSETDPLVRYRLNEALVSEGAPDRIQILLDALTTDDSPLVRQGAAQKLGNYVREQNVLPVLIQRLSQENVPAVRYAIARSLGISKDPAAIDALGKAAKDSDPKLRKQVAFSLKRHKSKKAGKILKKLKRDADKDVRRVAREK